MSFHDAWLVFGSTVLLWLKGSVPTAPMWLFRSDFSRCSGSAESWHVYCFCDKKYPCVAFFYTQTGKQGFKHVLESPPPCSRADHFVEGENLKSNQIYLFINPWFLFRFQGWTNRSPNQTKSLVWAQNLIRNNEDQKLWPSFIESSHRHLIVSSKRGYSKVNSLDL